MISSVSPKICHIYVLTEKNKKIRSDLTTTGNTSMSSIQNSDESDIGGVYRSMNMTTYRETLDVIDKSLGILFTEIQRPEPIMALLYGLLERIQVFLYRNWNFRGIPEITWDFPYSKITIYKLSSREDRIREEEVFLPESFIFHGSICEFTIMKDIEGETLGEVFELIGCCVP